MNASDDCLGPARVTLSAIPTTINAGNDQYDLTAAFNASPLGTYHVGASQGVLKNDASFGEQLIAWSVKSTQQASVVLGRDGSFDIAPTGPNPSFTYQVCALENPATGMTAPCATPSVQFTVPKTVVGRPDTYLVPNVGGLTAGVGTGVTANDVSTQSNPFNNNVHWHAHLATGPSHGQLSGFEDGTGGFTYAPTQGYSGPDSFTYTACDVQVSQTVCTPSPVTVSLQVEGPAPPPDTTAPTITVTTDPANASGGTQQAPVFIAQDLGLGGQLPVAVSAADNPGGVGVDYGQCTDNGNLLAFVIFIPSMHFSLGQGTHQIHCTWTDLKNNMATKDATFSVDTVAPSVSISSTPTPTGGTPSDRWFNAADLGGSFFYPNGPYAAATASATGGDIASIQCGFHPERTAVSGPGPTLPLPANFFGEGFEQASCTATDTNGNESAPAVLEFQVDTHPPTQSLAAVSPSGGTPSTPWFNATDVGGAGRPLYVSANACDICTPSDANHLYLIERWSGLASQDCTVDGGPPASSSETPFPVTLTDGVHEVSCTATDEAGNQSPPVSEVYWIDTTLPEVTAATSPGTTSAPFLITFSEPVAADGVQSFRVKADDGTKLAVTPSCASTPTDDGLCTQWKLTHATPLVPGQFYTIKLGATDAPITDQAGNPFTSVTRRLRAPTTLAVLDPSISYRWAPVSDPAAYGKSYVRENAPGATFSYTFTGTSVTWYRPKGPDQGLAGISIANPGGPAVHRVVDDYAKTQNERVPLNFTGLTDRTHTITITVRYEKNAAASDYFVSVDAFAVDGGPVVATPAGTPQWGTIAEGPTGRFAYSGWPGASFSTSFRGTKVTALLRYGPLSGIADVFVDGTKVNSIDLYGPDFVWPDAPFTLASGLADTVHTLRVVVDKKKNAASTGYAVVVGQVNVT